MSRSRGRVAESNNALHAMHCVLVSYAERNKGQGAMGKGQGARANGARDKAQWGTRGNTGTMDKGQGAMGQGTRRKGQGARGKVQGARLKGQDTESEAVKERGRH